MLSVYLMFSGAMIETNCISVELRRGMRLIWSNLGRVQKKAPRYYGFQRY